MHTSCMESRQIVHTFASSSPEAIPPSPQSSLTPTAATFGTVIVANFVSLWMQVNKCCELVDPCEWMFVNIFKRECFEIWWYISYSNAFV
jgi:hypothetical protein